MNNTANALLASGASPIMAHAPEEMDELVSISNALVINIGTLSSPWIESMFTAGRAAARQSVPLVLDPVGAGASRLRTETSMQLIKELHPAVIRGNASEVMALAGANVVTKGVDSTHVADNALAAAKQLASDSACTVVVSGEKDIVTDGTSVHYVFGGNALMPKVTGMGCTATVVVAAHIAVADSVFKGAICGMAAMSAAGSVAGEKATGPGSFQMHFIDALYSLSNEDITRRTAIS